MALPALLFTVTGLCASTATPKPAIVSAFGIGVSDLSRSLAFYTTNLGLKSTGETFNTTQFDEIILTLPGVHTGSAVVLMKWKIPKNIANVGVKLVFDVPDVKGTIEKMRTAGHKIVLEPGSGKVGNRTLPTAMALDPDGYIIELNPSGFLKR